MNEISDQDRISEIFHPISMEKIRKARMSNARFAYYTTADVASSVIRQKSVWMRNAAAMNDYREIEYGLERFEKVRGTPLWSRLARAVNGVRPELFEASVAQYDAFCPKLKTDTYITCVSMHNPEESDYGRLSMWRAYGGRNGVALVISAASILESQSALSAQSSPVEYYDQPAYEGAVERLAANIENNMPFLSQFSQSALQSRLFYVFLCAALCVKHPGFREEQEWRIFDIPGTFDGHPLPTDVETVRGTPQHVLKIPLGSAPGDPLAKSRLGDVVQQVLIGPSDFPELSKRAFISLLEDAGMSDADSRVRVSGIPLRHF